MILSQFVSDIGMKRSQNQDFAGIFKEHNLYVVADGMGGHKGGEVASQMAVSIAGEVFISEHERTPNEPGQNLLTAAKSANAAIMKRSQTEKELEGMGTTLVMLHFQNAKAYVGHVGDSRCYLVRDDGIWQITRDHSLVQEKLRAGLINREQLKTDRMKNVITRSVGFDANFTIDVYEYETKPGDLFLLCSDGLTGQMDDPQIHETVRKNYFNQPSGPSESTLKNVIEDLIGQANAHGGDDNCTVMLVQYLG